MRYLLLITVFLPFSLWGSPAEEPRSRSIPILDSVHNIFGEKFNHIANDFDSFFATERADDELGRSRFRVRRRWQIEEGFSGTEKTQLRFNLRLPSLEQKFKKILESKKEKVGETKEDREKRIQTLVDKNKLDTKWLYRGDVGTNVSIHPSITLRARLRKSAQTGTLIHRFVQEATWVSTIDGFRQLTTFDTDQPINDRFLFRFSNRVDWRISNKDFYTSHGPGIFQRLSDDEAINYFTTLGTTIEDKTMFMSVVSTGANYRRNVYRNFLYFDVTSGLNFHKQFHFRRTPFIYLQLEVLFGS
jgi:hypothetical protein